MSLSNPLFLFQPSRNLPPPGLDQQLLGAAADGGSGDGNVHNGFAKWPQPQPPPPLQQQQQQHPHFNGDLHEIRPFYPLSPQQQQRDLIEVGGSSDDSPPYLPAAAAAACDTNGVAVVAAADLHGVMPSAPSPLED